MMPGKCVECGSETGHFFILKKGEEVKNEVCLTCKKKLEKEGWVVFGSGIH